MNRAHHRSRYENLVARSLLKAAAKNADSIDQYVKTASELLLDARRPSNSPHGRNLMAYEGLFSLAMAVLEYHGTRPGEGDGHRISALQRFAADLGFTPGQVKTLTDAHGAMPAPTVRRFRRLRGAQAHGVVSLLEAALPKVRFPDPSG